VFLEHKFVVKELEDKVVVVVGSMVVDEIVEDFVD